MRPHSSGIHQYRNINLSSIGYAFRPDLRSRLPQSRSALLWKPWIFGLKDSHLHLATHSGILSSINSTTPSGIASLLMQCSSTNSYFCMVPRLRCRVSAPEIFGAGPLDQRAITHSFNVWLLLSQRPGCLRDPTSFPT